MCVRVDELNGSHVKNDWKVRKNSLYSFTVQAKIKIHSKKMTQCCEKKIVVLG